MGDSVLKNPREEIILCEWGLSRERSGGPTTLLFENPSYSKNVSALFMLCVSPNAVFRDKMASIHMHSINCASAFNKPCIRIHVFGVLVTIAATESREGWYQVKFVVKVIR